MPTEHDWEDEEPVTEEDALKRLVKRVDELNKGITGELWKMHQNCHKEAYENANPDHMPPDSPMVFVREEETKELFHVCRSCFSDWYVKQTPQVRDKVVVLRGELTEAANAQLKKEYAEAASKRETEAPKGKRKSRTK